MGKKQKIKKVSTNLPKLKEGKPNSANIQTLTQGNPIRDKTQRVNQKPSVRRQTPTRKVTNVKGLLYKRVSPQNGYAKPIVFIPPTEKPVELVNLGTNNKK